MHVTADRPLREALLGAPPGKQYPEQTISRAEALILAGALEERARAIRREAEGHPLLSHDPESKRYEIMAKGDALHRRANELRLGR